MSKETLSEQALDRYLAEHGYEWTTHPDYGVKKFPDREVRRGGLTAICEIKQFEGDPTAHLGDTGGGYIDRYGLIRGAVKEAAHQLRPLQELKLPLVVVLANPRRRLVDLSPENVWYALYGDEAVKMRVWRGEGPEPEDFDEDIRVVASRNGQIRNQHRYISAVALLREGWDGALTMEVLETLSESAVALPREFFDGPGDVRWYPDLEQGQMARHPPLA